MVTDMKDTSVFNESQSQTGHDSASDKEDGMVLENNKEEEDKINNKDSIQCQAPKGNDIIHVQQRRDSNGRQ